MLTDNDAINGYPIRAEIRVPRDPGANPAWLSSVVICQDAEKGTFIVWSVYATAGRVHAENGIYDIRDYGRALEKAAARVQDRIR